MAKVSVTIGDNDLRDVEQAAKANGMSVSAFIAKAATKAAMSDARRRYDQYLAENPEAAELIDSARARALRRGGAARRESARRHRQAAT